MGNYALTAHTVHENKRVGELQVRLFDVSSEAFNYSSPPMR